MPWFPEPMLSLWISKPRPRMICCGLSPRTVYVPLVTGVCARRRVVAPEAMRNSPSANASRKEGRGARQGYNVIVYEEPLVKRLMNGLRLYSYRKHCQAKILQSA